MRPELIVAVCGKAYIKATKIVGEAGEEYVRKRRLTRSRKRHC